MSKVGENVRCIGFIVMLYAVISGLVFKEVNKIQPGPYMDEIFHVPQAQRYCNGSWSEWDPKITTLPGTYVIGATVLPWLGKYGGILDSCSTIFLRGSNLIMSGMNLLVIYEILGFYMVESSVAKRALAALNIAMFPVLYFFSFVYYTDTVSTFFILLMHLMCLRGYFIQSAIAGACSVFTRQTNIVWVCWHGMINIWDVAVQFIIDCCIPAVSLSQASESKGPGRKQQRDEKKVPKKAKTNASPPKTLLLPPLNPATLFMLITKLFHRIFQLDFMHLTFGYLAVGILFVVFVLMNGGVVVGDKEAHQVGFNFPQLGYFTVMYGTFCFPFILRRLNATFRLMSTNVSRVFLVQSMFWIAAHFNSVVHPYLLADNRHYTFYLWKNVYKACPWMRSMLVPAYIFVWSFILSSMDVKYKYKVTFILCCVMNLVPQTLLEFRYFIPAYLFARMPISKVTWGELIIESAVYLCFNAVTFNLFLYKPFKWPDHEEQQRFMW